MKTMSTFIASAIVGLTMFGAPQALAGGYNKGLTACGYKRCYSKKVYYHKKKNYDKKDEGKNQPPKKDEGKNQPPKKDNKK